MKCFNDGMDAVAVCCHCGKALCRDCASSGADGRMVCSAICAEALEKSQKASKANAEVTRKSTQVTANSCVVLGAGLIALVGILHLSVPESDSMGVLYFSGFGLVFIIAGLRYRSSAKNG